MQYWIVKNVNNCTLPISQGVEMKKIKLSAIIAFLVLGSSIANAGFNDEYVVVDLSYLNLDNKVKSSTATYDINGYANGSETTSSKVIKWD